MENAAAVTRQRKSLDLWTELYGSWIPAPVLFHPAFLPGLSPKDFLILYTLFVYSYHRNPGEPDPVVTLRRNELQDRSGLGSGAAVTTAIHRLKKSGYLATDSKPRHYDISPLLSRLEERAREKKSGKLTLRDMTAVSAKLTKFVGMPNTASPNSPAISSNSQQSRLSKNTSRGGLEEEDELHARDIQFGCSWQPMSDKHRQEDDEKADRYLEEIGDREMKRAAERAFESIEDDKEFRKKFGDEVADKLYEHADIIEGISNEHISKAMRLMIGGWANDIDEALKLGASPNADDFLDQSRMLLTPTAAD